MVELSCRKDFGGRDKGTLGLCLSSSGGVSDEGKVGVTNLLHQEGLHAKKFQRISSEKSKSTNHTQH